MSFVHLLAGTALLGLCACTPAGLVGIDGHRHDPRQVPPGRVHVVVFLSDECPIANSYAPTLATLANGWAGRAVDLFLVHVGNSIDADRARAHARTWSLPGTVLLDPRQDLARALDVTRTPEAVVLGHDGLVYRGRIDDQWRAIGSRSPEPSRHDLRDAVDAALAGRAVPAPHPPAVGCLLPEPAR